VCLTNFDFFISLNSSSNENLINLKIIKSANKAPKPPAIAAIQILEGFKITKKPTAKGAEKPNANKIPAIKIPAYPKESKPETN